MYKYNLVKIYLNIYIFLHFLNVIYTVDVDEKKEIKNEVTVENNKTNREARQFIYNGNNYYEEQSVDFTKRFPTSTAFLIDNNYEIEKDKVNNYAYQGGVVSSGYNNNYYNNNNNKGALKIISDSRKAVEFNANRMNEELGKIDSSMISITTDNTASVEMTTKMFREAKDYNFPSNAAGSPDSAGSSSNNVNTNNYYKYPYPGSSDTASTGGYYYYYNNDDKNYWQTGPPALSTEKPGTTVLECHPSSMSGVLSEIFRVTGIAKMSILKAALITVLAFLIIKIPVLLILKAILFKVVLLPLGAASVLLPVLLPMVYLWPNLANALGITTTTTSTTTSTTTVAPAAQPAAPAAATRTGKSLSNNTADDDDDMFKTRALPLINARNIQHVFSTFLNSDRCIERIACKLGARDSQSTYRKHISWALKRLQSMIDGDSRRHVRLYRDAYNMGASKEDVCDKGYYPCEIPRITLVQHSHSYRII